MSDALIADIEWVTEITMQWIVADLSNEEVFATQYTVELARWLLSDPETRPTLRNWHVELTLNVARMHGWCDRVYTALKNIWPTHPQAGNDYWHDSRGRSAHQTSEKCAADSQEMHCECGHDCTDECRVFAMVWSSHGHRFVGTDEHNRNSCLTCGGEWQLVPYSDDEPDMGKYVSVHGEEAEECTGIDLHHGLENMCSVHGGGACEVYVSNGACPHMAHTHGCNCLLCDIG